MVWDVEGRGVKFLPQACKAVMWERYREIGAVELRALVARQQAGVSFGVMHGVTPGVLPGIAARSRLTGVDGT